MSLSEFELSGAYREERAMKLNFWQLVGVGLLVVGVGLWIYNKQRAPVPNTSGPTTAQVK